MSSSTVNPTQVRIGWIGSGIGNHLCDNLLKNGFRNLTVHQGAISELTNDSQELVKYLKGKYPEAETNHASSPKEVAASSSVIFYSAMPTTTVEEIVFGGDRGILSELTEGKTFVDCSTSQPSVAKKIANAVEKQKGFALDAPVSGPLSNIKSGHASFMVGGNKTAYESVLPCFKAMGKRCAYMGEAGQGQNTKIADIILTATGMLGLVEALHYAEKTNLDLPKLIALLSGGAASSFILSFYGPIIAQREFEPNERICDFEQDLTLALKEAKEHKLYVPGLETSLPLYSDLKRKGYGLLGIQALQLIIEQYSKQKINSQP